MRFLEDKLRPADIVDGSSSTRDAAVALLILGLMMILLPGWTGKVSPEGTPVGSDGTLWSGLGDMVWRLTRQMASHTMLMSMAFMLCLRRGVIDLSVWAVAALGGIVCVGAANAGVPLVPAGVIGVLTGAGVGALSGFIVLRTRIPGVVVTLVVGVGLVVVLSQAIGGRVVLMTISGGQFPNIENPMYVEVPAIVFAMVCYVLTMLVMMHCRGLLGDNEPTRNKRGMFFTLCASGALAAAAGVQWSWIHFSAPVPTRVVDDLTVPAAAILAGGCLLAGPKRTLLAGVWLPVAVAVTAAWRQSVLFPQMSFEFGYAPQVAMLLSMVAVSYWSVSLSTKFSRWRKVSHLVSGMAIIGIIVFGISGQMGSRVSRQGAQWLGLALWIFGSGGVIIRHCALRAARLTHDTHAGEGNSDEASQAETAD